MMPSGAIERRIRLSAGLLLLGLLVETLTLLVLHPLSFIVFASLGVLLIGAGIVVFLLTLLHAGDPGPP
jgi:hypothetical protein